MTPSNNSQLPGWLQASEDYRPGSDRDGFVSRSALSVASVLAHLRLDGGRETRFYPSAPIRLVVGLVLILLTSLSSNYAFVVAVLSGTLARMALLPGKALRRAAGISFGAAGLTVLLMLPALFIGQAQSALLIGTKVLVTTGVAMIVALGAPTHRLTSALRVFHVPNLLILTIDLTLKSIVTLGSTAAEVLQALRLRSVGKNAHKGTSMGGVAGVTLLKANQAAQDTSNAMSCRGFDGSYNLPHERWWHPVDGAWLLCLAVIVALFVYLEGIL